MTDQIKKVHPFEIAGLGKGPFKYTGHYEDRGPKKTMINGVACEVGAPDQPMGACDFCGNGIAYCCTIRSSDGKEFIVGTSCVEKTWHKGHPIYNAVQKEVRARKKAQTDQRNAEKIAQLKTWLEDPEVRDLLKSKKHPQQWRADQGDTRLEWALWFMKNAGVSGKLKIYRTIKKMIG